MKELIIKPLSYKQLPGLSEKQLSEHHDVLYAGYVKKTNEIRAKLESADTTTANATYSDLRSLKDAETFAVNGVKLHEAYFDSMGTATKPSETLLQQITKDFGSFENCLQMFAACGLAVRGWVILAWDIDESKLVIYASDSHDDGAVWSSVPLLVLDVYEHAYFLDYATARKKYIDSFMTTINWEKVSEKAKKWI